MNILDYIKGNKRGKNAKEFEKNLMRDPFLAEAMEGYESVKGNHDIIINRLRKNVSQKAKKKRNKQPMFIWSSIVAAAAIIGIIVLFFLGGFHNLLNEPKEYAVADTSMTNEIAPTVADTNIAHVIESTNKEIERFNEVAKNNAEVKTSTSKTVTPTPSISKEEKEADKILVQRKEETQQIAESKIQEEKAKKTALKDYSEAMIISEESTPVFFKVSGVVKDSKGKPIIGARITSTPSQETTTDALGKFALSNVLDGGKITFSYIGYQTKEIVANKNNEQLVVCMNENNTSLADQLIINIDEWKKAKEKSPKAEPSIGFKAYKEYVEANQQTAESKKCKEKSGKVKLTFATDKNGRPYNIRIVKGLCPEFDRQAISLINKGVAWTPSCKDVRYEIKF